MERRPPRHNKGDFVMSELKYTWLYRTRLINLKELATGDLFALLATRPEWVRNAVIKGLMRNV